MCCAFLLEFRYGLCIVCVGVQFPPPFTFLQGVSDVLEGSEDYLNTVISVGVVFLQVLCILLGRVLFVLSIFVGWVTQLIMVHVTVRGGLVIYYSREVQLRYEGDY